MLLPSKDVTPIRIREDLQILVAHLPHDLTSEEADKINRVIMAHIKQPQGGAE
jgi:hypothetical protein